MCTGGCSGGGGTSGKGRTPYTPKKSNTAPWTGGAKSSGSSSRNAGKLSDFGTPKVRVSFSSRNK